MCGEYVFGQAVLMDQQIHDREEKLLKLEAENERLEAENERLEAENERLEADMKLVIRYSNMETYSGTN